MKHIYFLIVFALFASNLNAQSYTSPGGSNTGAQNIIEVKFQGIDNTTNSLSSDFYHDYTGLTNNGTAATPGGNFSLYVTTVQL